jgi:hypothetical protein
MSDEPFSRLSGCVNNLKTLEDNIEGNSIKSMISASFFMRVMSQYVISVADIC